MKKKHLRLIIILAALLAGATAGLLGLRTVTANAAPVRVNLPEGTSFSTLCDSLTSNGVLHSTTAFRLAGRLRGLAGKNVCGSFVVQPHTGIVALAQKLYRGWQDPMRLTIGKFRTPDQLNAFLAQKLMCDDFHFTLDDFHLVRPDTYEVYWTVTPEAFAARMQEEYDRFWQSPCRSHATGNCSRADKARSLAAPTLTPREVVVLASIVEEETNNNEEKPMIASVYLNRLRRGMPLQADPTVKYAVGDFSLRRILNSHLITESPFNTYLHTGLPPAPICLPSAASVDAVLNAADTKYIYFCASPAMDGTHRFAATLTEHQRNAALFHAALNARGIK